MTDSQKQTFRRRYRWPLRAGIVLLLLIALPFIVHRIADWRAGAALQAKVAEIQARGEPILLEDFEREPIEDEANAAFYYREALAAWEGPNRDELRDDPGIITDDAAHLEKNKAVFDLVRQGGQCTQCDWQVELVSPGISVLLPQLTDMRELIAYLNDASMRHHKLGNDAEALALLMEINRIAQHLDATSNSIIEMLVATAVRAIVCERIADIAFELAVSKQDADGADNETRKRAEQLVALLLDETSVKNGQIDGSIGERGVMCYDTCLALIEGRLSIDQMVMGDESPNLAAKLQVFAMRPLFKRDMVYMLDFYTAIINASRETDNHMDFAAAMPPADHETGSPISHPLSRLLLPAIEAAYSSQFVVRAKTRMAAIALAIRLYEIDHGKRPDTLAQLVPDYLPAVPKDPFTNDGSTIKYRPNGVKAKANPDEWWSDEDSANAVENFRFGLLYSVGPDGNDDQGVVYINEDHSIEDKVNGQPNDVTFLLDAKPPVIELEEEDDPYTDFDDFEEFGDPDGE